MALVVQRSQVTLVKALEGIRTTYPDVWDRLSQGLREALEPEAKHVVRAPPPMLQVAQGRAQVAEDILMLLRHCSELAESLRRQNPEPVAGVPKFN